MANNEKKSKSLIDGAKSLAKVIGDTADKVGLTAEKVNEATDKVASAGKNVSETGKKLVSSAKNVDYKELVSKTVGGAKNIGTKTKEVATKSTKAIQNAAFGAIDQNGNGEVDIEDVIIVGLKMPGIRVNRENFLRKELFKRYPEEVIAKAIITNPMTAGIKSEDIDHIADEVIEYERRCVSGISAALSAPGGFAMAATIPADITQYYGYTLRATQKLLYLYGFPQIDTTEKGNKIDTETINILIICFGVMYGAAGANNALKAIAKAFANGVEKKLLKAALTKGTIYPIVKSVASWFGKKMTKDVFAGFFKKSIPLVGAALGGSITYLSFKPGLIKLKKNLQDTRLSNPNYVDDNKDIIDIEIIEE